MLERCVSKCDSHQGVLKGIRKVCQLMERCDGHRGDVRVLREVSQLLESVTVIREV